MVESIKNNEIVADMVIHQLKSYWYDVDEGIIREFVPQALEKTKKGFKDIPSERFSQEGHGLFNPFFSVHWMIFLYRLSNLLYKNGGEIASDQVYYLNKIMHAIDWYYGINLPEHFLCEHPLGSVLGKAVYGDWFLVYQGTTVGGSISNGEVCYPTIGDNVIMFSNSSLLGKTYIGNNVMISAGSRIINQEVPDNAIVFGESPNLIIKHRDEQTMISSIDRYWR